MLVHSASQSVYVFALCASLTSAAMSHHIQYSTVTGYFLQDLNTTNVTTFDYVWPFLLSFRKNLD
jgi:hypothetical protein